MTQGNDGHEQVKPSQEAEEKREKSQSTLERFRSLIGPLFSVTLFPITFTVAFSFTLVVSITAVAVAATAPEVIEGIDGAPGSAGLQGEQGIQGEPGLQGIQGEPGLQGNQGELGLPGEPGSEGPPGLSGTDGLNCWDVNSDGLRSIFSEDANRDGSVDVLDCRGTEGISGRNGTPGTNGIDGADGLDCWDLNGDGLRDFRTEDINGDKLVDVLDCQGPQGDRGPGITGVKIIKKESILASGTALKPLTAEVVCPTGMLVSGGGGFVKPEEDFSAGLVGTYPNAQGDGWIAAGDGQRIVVHVYAVCIPVGG